MMFTPGQIWAVILAVIGLVLTVLNILDKYIVMRDRAKQPLKDVEKRIDAIEAWQTVVDARLEEGNKHFDLIDKGNKTTHKALLALMDNALNGNSTDELKDARDALHDFLSGGNNR